MTKASQLSAKSRQPTAVGMFVYKDAAHDARVWKEAETLAESGRRVVIAALQTGHLPEQEQRGDVRLIRIRPSSRSIPGNSPARSSLLPLRRVAWLVDYVRGLQGWRGRAARRLRTVLGEGDLLVWHGHDLTGAVAADLARRRYGGRFVYDSHELFLDANSAMWLPNMLNATLASVERGVIRRADAVITVNSHIARELSGRYGVPPPAIVMNCPPLGSPPSDRLDSPLRHALGLGDRPVILFHGLIVPERVSTTLDALEYLPQDVAVVLLGQGYDAAWLGAWRSGRAAQGRLHLHPPVPMSDLAGWVAGADVGVMAFLGTSLNQLYFTPNKLFECLNAGVPVVASDFPTMRDIVTPDVGKLCEPEDPRSIASAIQGLLQEPGEQRKRRRIQCRLLAEQRYNWESEARGLLAIYAKFEGEEAHPSPKA